MLKAFDALNITIVREMDKRALTLLFPLNLRRQGELTVRIRKKRATLARYEYRYILQNIIDFGASNLTGFCGENCYFM
jgi:hypothetical protein